MDPIQFNKDIGDMEGTEARATLRDVRSKYSEAREDYEEAEELLNEYKNKYENIQEEAEEAREFFADFAADASGLDKETILDKFDSADEIRSEFLGEDVEFALSTEEDEEEETEFDDNPEKSDNLGGSPENDTERRAKEFFENSGMVVTHDE
jgi:predicted  nucleic acid-binding Zn-ribbon protein